MANNRDDFTSFVKLTAAQRVNYICSCPTCHCMTISASDEDDMKTCNVGEAAHICAAAPGGKRYDSNMTSEERGSIDNCIWLCKVHARMIDRDEKKYTVKLLKEWKKDAERYVQEIVAKSLKIEAEDVEILEMWFEKFRIKSWSVFTGKLLRPYSHLMEISVYEELVSDINWLNKNIHLIKNSKCRKALITFLIIFQKLLGVYIKHVEIKADGLYCTKPDRYGSYEYDEYGIDGVTKHNDLIWELTFELTKCVNEICEIIRNDYACNFAREKVDLCCSNDLLEGYYYLIVEYKDGETHDFDFESFLKDDFKRIFVKE